MDKRNNPAAKQVVRRLIDLEQAIERKFDCKNCGASAGHPCKPEYGCTPHDRLMDESSARK